MADAKWLKKAPVNTQDADDPFAELTRIMGFDPRVPFRSSEPAIAPQQVVAPNVNVSDDDLDFSIDLEQELMGALGDNEPETVEQASAGAYRTEWPVENATSYAAAEPSLDEQAYADFAAADEDGYANAGAGARAAAEIVQFAPRQLAYREDVAEDSEAAEYEAAGYAFDDAASASEDDRYAVEQDGFETVAKAAEVALSVPAEEDFYADEQEAASAYDVVEPTDTDHAAALAAELDEALVASFDNDLAYDDGDWEAEPIAQSPAIETVPAAPAIQQTGELSGAFDGAMAEVDMDFTSLAEPERFTETEPVAEPVYADFADELEASLSSEFAVEDVADEAVEVAAPMVALASMDDRYAGPADAEQYAEFDGDDATQPVPYFPSVGHYEAQAEEPAEPAPEEGDAQNDIDDAIAELAAMVRGYDRPQIGDPVAFSTPMPAQPALPAEDMPDIETVDVPEDAIALADDLDLPDLEYDEEPTPTFDDLDAELAAAFGEPAVETVQPARPAEPIALPFDLDSGYDAKIGGAAGYAGAGAAAAHQALAQGRGNQAARREPAGSAYAQPDFDVDADLDDDLDLAGDLNAAETRSPRKGLLIASVVGGIAVLGVIGAFAFSGGGGVVSGEPALVKADTDPIKVKPENPGGTTVPNQESRVFDRAAGTPAGQPEQQTLISAEEEPVDVASRFPEEVAQPIDESADIEELSATTPKGEERIEQVASAPDEAVAEPTVAVEPRKVRTMVVKPDGTLVPREEVAAVAGEPEAAGSTTAAGSLTDPTISAQPAQEQPLGEPTVGGSAQAAAEQTPPAATAGEPRTTNSTTPSEVPVAPSRPADQPLDIVGEVKADKVAAIDPAAATPAPAGAWSMQIASQPSEAAARSSYQDLSRRYAKVLGDRSANIVKAEIAGKGTFWRVRVPAGTRNDAISLCESYKAAGGNCFVSK